MSKLFIRSIIFTILVIAPAMLAEWTVSFLKSANQHVAIGVGIALITGIIVLVTIAKFVIDKTGSSKTHK